MRRGSNGDGGGGESPGSKVAEKPTAEVEVGAKAEEDEGAKAGA